MMLQRSSSITRASVRSAQRRHPTTTSCRALLSHLLTTTNQHCHDHQKQQQQRRRPASYNNRGASTRHAANTSTITKGSGKNANNGDFNTPLFKKETVQEAIRRGVVSVARARKSTTASALDEEEQEDAVCVEALERDGGEVEGGLRIFRLTGEL